MEAVLWIVQAVLALAFLGAGALKLAKSKRELQANPQMAWTNDFSQPVIKLIGTAEVLGAIGLILPALTDIVPILTPIAAVGLALVMAGAVATHVRRKEPPALLPPIVLGALAVLVAWGRFGPYAF